AVATDVEGTARVVFFALTGRAFGSPGPQSGAAWGAAFRRAMHPRDDEAFANLDAFADALEAAGREEAPPSASTTVPSLVPPLVSPAAPAPVAARRPTPVSVPWMIGLGAVACLVIAMCVAVAVKLAKHAPSPGASASVAAAAPAPEASSAAPEPSASPSAPPLASEEAPAPSASVAADTPPPADEPKLPPSDHWHGLLVVRCSPSCDSVFVDGHVVAHPDRGKLLAPGVHTVAVNLANHTSKVQPVLLRRGRVKRLDVSF
ncbi:MAG TPA: hypothetical protein VF765_15355, partial [Polyangiaceae bacterium]